MAKVPFDAERGQGTIKLDADRIVTINDKSHPRYDTRIDSPLTEEFIVSIAQGQIYPVIVFENEDGKPEIVDGRHRLRAIRENNRRLMRGAAQYMVNCQYLRIRADEDPNEVVNAYRKTANLHHGDSISAKAREATKHMERYGWSAARTGILFGVTATTIEKWQEIQSCAAPVLAALDAGRIGLGAAVELSSLAKGAQVEKLADMTEGKAPRAGKKKATKPSGRPGIAAIKKLGPHADRMEPQARAVLRFVLGELDMSGLVAAIPALDGAIEVSP